jgi:WD40 repeat protein
MPSSSSKLATLFWVLVLTITSVTTSAAQQGHSPLAATPVAETISGWQVAEITPLDVEGTPVTLSPDGSFIAGVSMDGGFCIWSVPDLDPTCAGSDLDIDPDSLAWAPDSSVVAFSVQAYRMMIDGDIFVFELADGDIHNVTDDGLVRMNVTDGEESSTPVDVMPAWTPDSAEIVFSRTVYDDREELSNELMRIPRIGGEPETLLSLRGLPASIYLPMRVLADGSVLYTVGLTDQSEPQNGIWRLSPQGEATQLMAGGANADFPMPVINGVWEGNGEVRIVGHSSVLLQQFEIESPVAFTWSSVTGEPEPVIAGVDSTTKRVYSGEFSPDGGTLLALERSVDLWPQVSLYGPSTSTVVLPEISAEIGPGRPIYTFIDWSSANVVLVPPFLTDGGYLLEMKPNTSS